MHVLFGVLLSIGLVVVLTWWASDIVSDGVDRVLGPRKDER